VLVTHRADIRDEAGVCMQHAPGLVSCRWSASCRAQASRLQRRQQAQGGAVLVAHRANIIDAEGACAMHAPSQLLVVSFFAGHRRPSCSADSKRQLAQC
jgi:hypothetical protein